jgi:hypothetical protein
MPPWLPAGGQALDAPDLLANCCPECNRFKPLIIFDVRIMTEQLVTEGHEEDGMEQLSCNVITS